jgi:hypothetical protein
MLQQEHNTICCLRPGMSCRASGVICTSHNLCPDKASIRGVAHASKHLASHDPHEARESRLCIWWTIIYAHRSTPSLRYARHASSLRLAHTAHTHAHILVLDSSRRNGTVRLRCYSLTELLTIASISDAPPFIAEADVHAHLHKVNGAVLNFPL